MANTRKAAESTTANAFETTLSSQLGASDLTVNVASTTGLASPCYIVIEPDSATQREYIFIDSTVAGTSFTTTTVDNRYLSGSAAGSGLTHPSGSKVRVAPMKQHFEDIFDALGKVVDTSYSSGTAGEVVFDVADGTVDVANDEIFIRDANDSNKVKRESVADLVAGIDGTGLTASSGVLNVGGLTTSEIAAASLVTESETITSNDNDTTIPTSAAVKNYADAEAATLTNKTLGAVTLSGAVTGGDQTISAAVLQDYAETKQAVTSSSGAVAIDLANGNVGTITLTENITVFNFTNVPSTFSTFQLYITQHASSDKTVAISTTVNGGGAANALTSGAGGYTMTTGANKVDIITFAFVGAATPHLSMLQDMRNS
jgi:hypothetical protein